MKKIVIPAVIFLVCAVGTFFAFPLFIGGGLIGAPIQASTAVQGCTTPPASPVAVGIHASQLTPSQLHYAEIIIGVAIARHLTVQDAAIGVATAMQESSLSDPTVATNADSLGLFQQRPSQGWGTPAQLTDPVYATNAFDNALVKVPNRDNIPLTVAAQDVQHSGNPSAYAQWTSLAEYLAHQAYDNPGSTGAGATSAQTMANCNATFTGSGAATGRLAKVVHAALSQVGLPYIWGGETAGVGFDCSGLTQWAYAQAGVSIPRVANDQYNALSDKISPITPANLRPGDLLFENWDEQGPGTGWGHVAMYVGGGTVVEAPQPGFKIHTMPLSQFGAVAAARVLPNG